MKLAELSKAAKSQALSVVVINDDRIAYQNYFGVRDMRTNAKPDAHDFLCGFLCHPCFAYAFLKLVEKRIFDLDAPFTHIWTSQSANTKNSRIWRWRKDIKKR